MEDVLRFFILGLGLGGIYALIGLALVLVYRGSGVVNFATTGMTLLSAAVFHETYGEREWPVGLGILAALSASVAAGLAVQFLIMRPLRTASPLMRIVATLAVLALIQSIAEQVYGSNTRQVKSFLPDGAFRIFGTSIGQDRVIILLIACALTVVLWLAYKRTRFGLATTAVAENDLIPASVGWSPNWIASLNWAIGALLAGLGGVLLAPIVGLSGSTISLMIVPALTVSLISGFSSFPLTLFGGLALGVLQSETLLLNIHDLAPLGAADFVPLILIVGMLIVRGRSIPLRGYLADRLPRLGSGRIGPVKLLVGLVLLYLSAQAFSTSWLDAITTTFVVATLCLSLVVVTGYCGQLSLAQYAFAGIGALLSARMAATWELGFLLSLVLAMLVTVVIGAVLALPAIRLRGVNLAVVTLAGAVAVNSAVLSHPRYTGGFAGLTLPTPSIFGWKVGAVTNPGRYAVVVVVAFCLVGLAVANLRRGRVGRRLVAVRSNERAAASLGISVAGAKLYAFAVGAGIAACGGVLMVFRVPTAYFGGFSPIASIRVVLQTVVGGVGYATGSIMGGVGAPAAVADQSLSNLVNTKGWFTVVSAVILLIIVITHHDGMVDVTITSFEKARTGVSRLVGRGVPGPRKPAPEDSSLEHIEPTQRDASWSLGSATQMNVSDARSLFDVKVLKFQNVGITFGGVVAVDDVSLEINPGEVVGLIGPNGAGKTTILDIATGFHRRYRGSVLLGGVAIDGLNAVQRARAGVVRSFQSLELFDDLTVEENIRAASEPRDRAAYLTDLVYPRKSPLGPIADAVIHQFGLAGDLGRTPGELHLAQRRLLAVARAIAARPSVLLLDEPAAGLDETSRAELSEVIRWVAKSWGLGVLLIEHDVSLVLSTCERVVALDFGRVIASDTSENIVRHDGVIQSYLGRSIDPDEAIHLAQVGEGVAP